MPRKYYFKYKKSLNSFFLFLNEKKSIIKNCKFWITLTNQKFIKIIKLHKITMENCSFINNSLLNSKLLDIYKLDAIFINQFSLKNSTFVYSQLIISQSDYGLFFNKNVYFEQNSFKNSQIFVFDYNINVDLICENFSFISNDFFNQSYFIDYVSFYSKRKLVFNRLIFQNNVFFSNIMKINFIFPDFLVEMSSVYFVSNANMESFILISSYQEELKNYVIFNDFLIIYTNYEFSAKFLTKTQNIFYFLRIFQFSFIQNFNFRE